MSEVDPQELVDLPLLLQAFRDCRESSSRRKLDGIRLHFGSSSRPKVDWIDEAIQQVTETAATAADAR